MDLATARHYAAKIATWLSPLCERIEVAGSIRRERPTCNDVDIVCIPKLTVYKDMFGTVEGQQNQCWQFLRAYADNSHGAARIESGGESAGKLMIVRLPKCQLDIWFATEATFASQLVCRTGSKEHNIWVAQRAERLNLKWKPSEGLFKDDGTPVASLNEADFYDALDLLVIPPQRREAEHLHKF